MVERLFVQDKSGNAVEIPLSGESGSGGSIIKVTTTDSSLYGGTATATIGTYSKSATISDSGVALIDGFTGTGTITITATNGTVTATDTLNVPYYGSYEIAVVAVTVSFYEGWLESINHSTTGYADLDDVLADEELLRELFTRHDSVDYLVTNYTGNETDIATIINDDYCAKWINLRDYALDTLYANASIAALMDTADKYFYGEWTIVDDTTTPATWGAKGNVPVMTADNAPYGTASAGSYLTTYSRNPFHAFDGNTTGGNCWSSANTSAGDWLRYDFTNPVKVKELYVYIQTNISVSFKFQGSNDGTTWTDITDDISVTISEHTEVKERYPVTKNEGFYISYRLYCLSPFYVNTTNSAAVYTLQFYGRELKVSVPTMTSNTAPWGEVITNTSYTNYSNMYYSYGCFDKNTSTYWIASSNTTGQYIAYKFNMPVVLKELYINYLESSMPQIPTFKLQASNDGTTWTDILSINSFVNDGTNHMLMLSVNNDTAYLYYRLYTDDISHVSGTYGIQFTEINFFCENYSEYDWDTDCPRHYIYDHGVEPNETMVYRNNGNAYIEHSTGTVYFGRTATYSGNPRLDGACASIDTTAYSLARLTAGEKGTFYQVGVTSMNFADFTADSTSSNDIASNNKTLPINNPYTDVFVDISNVNGTYYVGSWTGAGAVHNSSFTELWLE